MQGPYTRQVLTCTVAETASSLSTIFSCGEELKLKIYAWLYSVYERNVIKVFLSSNFFLSRTKTIFDFG